MINKIDIGSLKLNIRMNFPRFCGEERTIEAVKIVEELAGLANMSNGCKYCLENETVMQRDEPLTQVSIEVNMLVLVDIFGIKGIEIKYCPLCGRKLEVQYGKVGNKYNTITKGTVTEETNGTI